MEEAGNVGERMLFLHHPLNCSQYERPHENTGSMKIRCGGGLTKMDLDVLDMDPGTRFLSQNVTSRISSRNIMIGERDDEWDVGYAFDHLIRTPYLLLH